MAFAEIDGELVEYDLAPGEEMIVDTGNVAAEVIRPVDNPYTQTGGLAVLTGNLAPDGGVVKKSAVCEEMMVHEGPARVFDCEEDAIAAIKGGKIVPGTLQRKTELFPVSYLCGPDYCPDKGRVLRGSG